VTPLLWGLLWAALACWALGAYNRLVQLRAAVASSFEAVTEQLLARHTLIYQLAQAASHAVEPSLVETVQAATEQAGIALELASKQPINPAAITSLALAEQVLNTSLARLAQTAPWDEPAPPAAQVQLQTTNTKLAFTQNLFNTAVRQYNHAVQQRPANVLCKLCSFHRAAYLPEPP
jgi:LemA protein